MKKLTPYSLAEHVFTQTRAVIERWRDVASRGKMGAK